MCGICGVVSPEDNVDPILIGQMMAAMSHRGPDEEGRFVDRHVGLGHQRLSIIDLSGGHQPMTNEDGTVIVVFNGEIYNFQELRRGLVARGHKFVTTSDTEVIVHLYEEVGDECVGKLEGMFAFALWDARKRRLLLARDRVGIKPLYFVAKHSRLTFGSEIKAVLVDPLVNRTVNVSGIDTFLTFCYMPGPDTLLSDVKKLLPGCYLTWSDGTTNIQRYWDLTFPSHPRAIRLEAASDELDSLLRQTTRAHMISDVPVGVLLSGGVDSTGLLSYCVEEATGPVNTFTVGFEGHDIEDERPYARLAAQIYGTTHHETTISATSFCNTIPRYVWHMEEPVCEPPAIALYHITQLARQHVKVLISGEGGDEAFAGYNTYRNLAWIEQLKTTGQFGRRTISGALSLVSRVRRSQRLAVYAALMKTDLRAYYYSRTATPFNSFNVMKRTLYTTEMRESVGEPAGMKYLAECFRSVESKDVLSQLLYVDTKTWLPDDLLVKADKMTMAHSVELRVPLLDHHILEFAAQLPSHLKLRGTGTKRVLKHALRNRVPRAIIRRRKTGFPVPIQTWMRQEFKNLALEVLLDGRTVQRGYFQAAAIERAVAVAAETGCGAKEVFGLTALELWHRYFADSR